VNELTVPLQFTHLILSVYSVLFVTPYSIHTQGLVGLGVGVGVGIGLHGPAFMMVAATSEIGSVQEHTV
jgi:hypothetical protein